MKDGNFLAELKRRNVYKVAVAYAVVGWLLVQVATQVLPFFEIPNWAVRLVVLAIVIGYYVIGKVHHALHTPLMSVTNAISGIIVVGALLQVGQGSLAVTILAFGAILLATINIFGGFAVTRRMLGMFTKAPVTGKGSNR